MLEKDRYLEKFKYLILVLILFSSFCSYAKNIKSELLIYNKSLKNTSVQFIQNDGDSVEEGVIYIGDKRVRVDYLKPNKISLVLTHKKGMYLHHELKEAEFFNIENSYVNIFIKILTGVNIFYNSTLQTSKNRITISHNFELDDTKYIAEIIYENKPIKVRKIQLFDEKLIFEMGFFNHMSFDGDKNLFSLINPFTN